MFNQQGQSVGVQANVGSASAAQRPRIGDVVHYVLPGGRYPGEHRPAFVVKVWSETHVNLQVFVDGANDYPEYNGSVWATSVPFDASGRQLMSWHWPEPGA